MDVPFYPMFVALDGRTCLVAGGGAVGERKVRKLIEYGASEVRVAAVELTPWLDARRLEGVIAYAGREYHESLMDGVHLVFAATSDPALNLRIASDARKRGIWCNMATNPEAGSFIVPAVFRQGPLSIAVSTEGLSPALARNIKEMLEKQFGPEWSAFLTFLGLLRSAVQAKVLGTAENQRIFREAAELPMVEWMRNNGREMAVDAVHRICGPHFTREEISQIWNESWKLSS